mgnify:CR=1 FL=1
MLNILSFLTINDFTYKEQYNKVINILCEYLSLVKFKGCNLFYNDEDN